MTTSLRILISIQAVAQIEAAADWWLKALNRQRRAQSETIFRKSSPSSLNILVEERPRPTAMTAPLTAPLSRTQRLKRVFNIDITRCPLCAGQLRVIRDVTDPDHIRKILDHRKQRAPTGRSEAPAYPQQTRADLFAWHS